MFQLMLFISCLLSAVWAYQVNYEARAIKREIQDLDNKIQSVKNRINLLEAEWAFLNRPKRLARLVDENFSTLRLVPITRDHFKDSITLELIDAKKKERE